MTVIKGGGQKHVDLVIVARRGEARRGEARQGEGVFPAGVFGAAVPEPSCLRSRAAAGDEKRLKEAQMLANHCRCDGFYVHLIQELGMYTQNAHLCEINSRVCREIKGTSCSLTILSCHRNANILNDLVMTNFMSHTPNLNPI